MLETFWDLIRVSPYFRGRLWCSFCHSLDGFFRARLLHRLYLLTDTHRTVYCKQIQTGWRFIAFGNVGL